MSVISNEISLRLDAATQSQRSKSIIKDFLNEASGANFSIEFGLGDEKWQAIDIWNSGYLVGLIFPKGGKIKFFNKLVDSNNRSYKKAILNNRNEWVFEVKESPDVKVMVECLMDNLLALPQRLNKSNRRV